MASAGYLGWDEMKELVLSLDNGTKAKRRLGALIHLGCHVALRISDLLGLKWEDVINNSAPVDIILVREKKTLKTRKITLHPDAGDHLMEYYHYLGDPPLDQLIFTGRNGALTTRYVNYELERLRKKYGLNIDQFSTHTLRKTWARRVWDAGDREEGRLEMISMALNHSSTSITRRYLGVTQKEISNLYLSV